MTTTTATEETFEVCLAVYDLARGMARSFLQQQADIDIIPHTGVVCYGREWFFGDGIQSEAPHEFRRNTGMQPVQELVLGRTRVPRRQWEQWCQRMAARDRGPYSATSYDLLTRNCNNFSYDAVTQGLGLSAQVFPTWILDVPRRFLSSPMGQMVRPLLENMRVTHPAGAQSVLPAMDAAPPQTPTPPPPPPPSDYNPWANIPSPQKQQQQTTAKVAPLSTNSSDNDNEYGNQNSSSKKTNVAHYETPFLDSFTKPLLSSEVKTVGLCIQKIVARDSTAKDVLEDVAPILRGASTAAGDSAKLTADQTEAVGLILLRVLESTDGGTEAATTRTFALMLLRIVVLRSSASSSSLDQSIEWLQTQLVNTGSTSTTTADTNDSNHNTDRPLLTSAASRSMAWLATSNVVATRPLSFQADWADAALVDLSHARPEVRQAASAVLYNGVLLRFLPSPPSPSRTAAAAVASRNDGDEKEDEEEVSDTVVSILCSVLERVGEETDATTQLRELLILGRILQPVHHPSGTYHAAKRLVVDLGLSDALAQLVSDTTTSSQDCQKLASELLQILQN